jgi:hypothetical protein
MEQSIELLEFLNNLILSISKDTMKISKATFIDIKRHLHYAHETIEFIQLDSQPQCDELQ